MKRYLIFGFGSYDAGGGMNDLMFEFDDVNEMKKTIKEIDDSFEISGFRQFNHYNVLDTKTGEVFGNDNHSLEEIVEIIQMHEEKDK